MINRAQLLTDLQALLRKLEADLLERSDSFDVPEVGEIPLAFGKWYNYSFSIQNLKGPLEPPPAASLSELKVNS